MARPRKIAPWIEQVPRPAAPTLRRALKDARHDPTWWAAHPDWRAWLDRVCCRARRIAGRLPGASPVAEQHELPEIVHLLDHIPGLLTPELTHEWLWDALFRMCARRFYAPMVRLGGGERRPRTSAPETLPVLPEHLPDWVMEVPPPASMPHHEAFTAGRTDQTKHHDEDWYPYFDSVVLAAHRHMTPLSDDGPLTAAQADAVVALLDLIPTILLSPLPHPWVRPAVARIFEHRTHSAWRRRAQIMGKRPSTHNTLVLRLYETALQHGLDEDGAVEWVRRAFAESDRPVHLSPVSIRRAIDRALGQ